MSEPRTRPSDGEAPPHLRLAELDDVPRLQALIEASVRGLQGGDHSPEQIERSLNLVFGVDRQLIADKTYFVIEAGGELVACGGWSFRRTLFGADAIHGRDDGELNPALEPAKIRAFFVAPDWARRGLGALLLARCEAEAAVRGFKAMEMGATLTGVPLYARYGYAEVQRLEAPLSDGFSLPVVRMAKRLTPG